MLFSFNPNSTAAEIMILKCGIVYFKYLVKLYK